MLEKLVQIINILEELNMNNFYIARLDSTPNAAVHLNDRFLSFVSKTIEKNDFVKEEFFSGDVYAGRKKASDAYSSTQSSKYNRNSFLTAKRLVLPEDKQPIVKNFHAQNDVSENARRLLPPNGGVLKRKDYLTDNYMTEIVNYSDVTKQKPWYQELYQVRPDTKTDLLYIRLFVNKNDIIHEANFSIHGKLDTKNEQNVKIITKNGIVSLNELGRKEMVVQIEKDRISHNQHCKTYFNFPFLGRRLVDVNLLCIIKPD